jgi:hypothetical protein
MFPRNMEIYISGYDLHSVTNLAPLHSVMLLL